MIKTCQHCGILYRAFGNMKYCVVCSYEVKVEYWRKQSRRYRETHREQWREYQREYRRRCRKSNPEKIREYEREYYRRQKLKLIREILSATATVLNRKEHIT